MIADTIEAVGVDGGITVEGFDGLGVYSEVVEGFYYRKGFTHEVMVSNPSARESRIDNADILITEKVMKSIGDIAPILDKIIQNSGKGSELVIIGDIQDEALAVLAENMSVGNIKVTLVGVPEVGQMRTLFMEDIATLTGGKVIMTGSNGSSFDIGMLGGADKVIVNAYSTSIIGGQGEKEDAEALIAQLRQELEESDNQIDLDVIRGRLSRITGKIVNVRVGGATPIERDETKLRVDDAVCAVQAALRGGIVPGGGVALAHVDAGELSGAYIQLFVQLVENAGYNTEKALFKVQDNKNIWQGFNLRQKNFDYETINLIKAGVVDPALVIKEVVQGASSVVSTLITTSVGELSWIIALAVGYLVGYEHRVFKDQISKLQKEKPVEPDIGFTMGDYKPANEQARVNQDGEVGLVEPKTPERISWETDNSIEKEALGR